MNRDGNFFIYFRRVTVTLLFFSLSLYANSENLSDSKRKDGSSTQLPSPKAFQGDGTKTFEIPVEKIDSLKAQALKGSRVAAEKLSNYYVFNKFDRKEELYWLQIAAENGSVLGMYNFAVAMSSGKPTELQKIRAKYWLALAKSAGLESVGGTEDDITALEQELNK